MKEKEKDTDLNPEQKYAALQEEIKIQTYKWLKIVQSIILMALGVIFIVISLNSDTASAKALGLSLGIVLSVYGLIDVAAGYLLHRSIICQEILIGVLFISFALVMFRIGDAINTILSTMMLGVIFGYAVMLIIYGVDRIVAKGIKKNIPAAVFSFIGSALLIAGGVVYLVFEKKDSSAILKYVMMIFGAVLIAVGIVSLIVLLVKLYNTRQAMKDKEIKEKAKKEAEVTSKEEQHEVRVIDINDLKKQNKKKKKNTETIDISAQNVEDEPKQIEDTKNDSSEEDVHE